MPKYYIESGNVRTIVSAGDSEKAALWVVHRAMQQVLPVYEESDPGLESDGADGQGPSVPKLMVLGSSLLISETGFGGSDREEYETLALVNHWNRLMVALERLQALETAA